MEDFLVRHFDVDTFSRTFLGQHGKWVKSPNDALAFNWHDASSIRAWFSDKSGDTQMFEVTFKQDASVVLATDYLCSI